MKTEKFEGIIESAYGKAITALKYSAEYGKFESTDELRAANKYPSEKEILAFVNAANKAAARQAGMQVALTDAGYEKPDLKTDPQLRLRNMVKILVASGLDEAEALDTAKATLKM